MTATKNLIQAAAGVGGGDFYPYTVDNSARFASGSDKLTRTNSGSGSTKGCFSMWVKRSTLNPSNFAELIATGFGEFYFANSTGGGGVFTPDSIGFYEYFSSSYQGQEYGDTVFRDVSAWYHVFIVWDTTLATGSDRYQVWINNQRIPLTISSTVAQNTLARWFYTGDIVIGNNSAGTKPCLSYLAEVVGVEGTAYAPTDFGQNKNGVWVPKNVSGLTFGTNGFYLKFGNSGALGTDSSGNGNNFTVSGLTSSDQMIDTPTNKFATLNPLESGLGCSDGNLVQNSGASAWRINKSTVYFNVEEDWYFEARLSGSGSDKGMIGISVNEHSINTYFGNGAEGYGYNMTTGGKYSEGAGNVAYGSTAVAGDIIGVHISGGSLTFYKNGVSQGVAYSGLTGYMTPSFAQYLGYSWTANFGQNGTFNGAITAGGNTDANGLGDFKYTVPTGALALCTANFPEPTIGPNSATTSGEHFNTVLYTGTGSARSVTGFGFQPDNLAIKTRSISNHWHNVDAVRGVSNALAWSWVGAEFTSAVDSFDSDGFSVYDGQASVNGSGTTYVAYGWKGNGSGVSNTDGSITSTVSANQDAGISIVKYTGNAVSGATIGHGLGVAPKVIIQKGNAALNWPVWFYDISYGTNNFIQLNLNNGTVTDSTFWTSTAPTSTVFSVGNSTHTNSSSYFSIAYCFAEVEGFSKFGTYTGNGSADGPFIYTGFRPAFVLIKSSSNVENWRIIDSKRNPTNQTNYEIYPNLVNTEGSIAYFDFLSNGFKVRVSGSGWNGSGYTFIYMAFSEMPFKYSNAR